MKTYEHTVIHHVQTTKHHTFRTDTEEPCWAKGPLTLRGFYKAEAEMLHAAGQQGWRLIAVTQGVSAGYYFSRETPEMTPKEKLASSVVVRRRDY